MEKSVDVEISELDRRYETWRIRDKDKEGKLLISIDEFGVIDPLRGAEIEGEKIVLDGFKRLRCALKVGKKIVPFISIAESEAEGILELIRRSESKSLSFFEQIKLLETLKNEWRLSIPDIAERIDKSTGWVGMRMGVMDEIPAKVVEKIMNGSFSGYAYMYYVRPFMRMKNVTKADVTSFVKALSGKNVPVRSVKELASTYFLGSKEIREQIEKGNFNWGLNKLKQEKPAKTEKHSTAEYRILRNLESLRKGMKELVRSDYEIKDKSPKFLVQANIIIEGILEKMEIFSQIMRVLYDQSREKDDNLPAPPAGNEQTPDLQRAES